MSAALEIRACAEADVPAVCAIYNHYIAHTVITFEEQAVTVAEMAARIANYSAHYPWLVALREGRLLGYAYASKWHARSAYRHSVESTVYLDAAATGQGVGRALYTALLPELQRRDCHVVMAAIALPNEASVALHERFGFDKVGHMREIGRKFGRWVDVGYWQKMLAPEQPG